MTTRITNKLSLGALCLGLTLFVSMFLASAAEASPLPGDLCDQPKKSISAAVLKNGVRSTPDCELVDRTVSTGNIAVQVPKEGRIVGGAALAKAPGVGDELVVSNSDGVVRAITRRPQDSVTKEAAVPPCDDSDYNTHLGHQGAATRYWLYNNGNTPSWLNLNNVVTAIRNGNKRATTGWSDCDFQYRPQAYGSYLGYTSQRAGMWSADDGTVTCDDADSDSVVDWIPIPQTPDGGVTLAVTCWWTDLLGNFEDADIAFGVDGSQDLRATLPSNCGTEEDIESVAAHEWGHFFGLDHATGEGNANLTMFPSITACTTDKRSYGLGDWLGMIDIYDYV